MPKRKHYTSAEAIELDIAHARMRRRRLLDELAAQESAAAFFEAGTVDRRHADEAMDKLHKQIDRLENRRLKQLQRTLAAFNTAPLPLGETATEEVQLQNP